VTHDEDQGITLWHAKDNSFKVPQTDIVVQVAAPEQKTYRIGNVKYQGVLAWHSFARIRVIFRHEMRIPDRSIAVRLFQYATPPD
jgi:hypothetical protein